MSSRVKRARRDDTAPQGRRYDKPALTHAALVERMEARGLRVEDEARAQRYLRDVGYYRLTPYMLPFQEGPGRHRFQGEVSLDDVIALYAFDRHLRLLVMDAMERIEVALRAALTDHMSTQRGGPHWYLDARNFASPGDQRRMEGVVKRMCDDERKRRPVGVGDRVVFAGALEHYLRTYTDPPLPPSWIVVENMTFGDLRTVVASLADPADISAVAARLGINATLLESWMRSYQRVRNICAHHGRLWNVGLGVYPKLPARGDLQAGRIRWLADPSCLVTHPTRAKRLYPVLVSMQSILRTIAPHSGWPVRLRELVAGSGEVPLTGMGMFPGWDEDAFWVAARTAAAGPASPGASPR